MLRHAIAPVRRYTKASHDVVRHSRLNSDAKVLLLYVQGLPESEATAPKPLSEHAARLGLKGRAYQKAKQLLGDCGYLYEWREQGARGRWVTEQLLANVTLTREEASRAREGREGREGCEGCESGAAAIAAPSEHLPTVGGPGERSVGDSTADLRRALSTGLPADGVRSAVGFLRHRLVQKLPAARAQAAPPSASASVPAPEWVAVPARRGLVTCPGPGDEHVFRPRGDETHCFRCRSAAAFEATLQPLSGQWRTRVQECVV